MADPSRRRFLELASVSIAGALLPGGRVAARNFRHDLLLRGGEVIDPSQQLRARKDIAVSGQRIADLKSDLPVNTAARVFDATGKLVIPGLIDLHAHLAPDSTSQLGLSADELMPFTGVTTCVSAGDVGHLGFEDFKRTVIKQAQTRVFAFLHISKFGLTRYPAPEMLDIGNAEVGLAADAVAKNSDIVLGLKVRMGRAIVGDNGLEPLRRALTAAKQSGVKARVMCHIGDAPGDLSTLLELLRPGDILTHAYSRAGNNIVQNGKVLPAALAAKKRGVIIDVGHGGGSFDYSVVEPAIAQGLKPDTISSDLHMPSSKTPGKPYLPWVMSKFLALGFSIEEVVAMTTINPARLIGKVPGMGTLKIGAPADITILEQVEQNCSFVDTRNNKRQGVRFLRPVAIVRAGRLFSWPSTTATPYP
ncbi:MAG TPA: amidohydrolase/deacetylase family metallohydrolase [Pyrinomonadaceae bacterium]|nr:amidohydrolase/deacetylase family metallohydrolase [Pyrinomonadaceae bacterium]